MTKREYKYHRNKKIKFTHFKNGVVTVKTNTKLYRFMQSFLY